jgi:plasmid stability protein
LDDMPNLTLTLDADLLRRARTKAAEQGTSVNAVVREHLEAFVGPSTAEAGVAILLELAGRSTFTLGEGGIGWSREALHDRADLR